MSRFKIIAFVFALTLAIQFANSNQASAQQELLERVNQMRIEAQELAEMGRTADAEAMEKKAAATYKAFRQRREDQESKTKQDIESLMRLLRGLESKLDDDPSEEEAQHLKREIERVADTIDARTAELDKNRHNERDRSFQRARQHQHAGDGNEQDHEDEDDEPHERDHGDDGEHEHDELIHRLEHMHRAMEHLHESGLHDLAEQVEQRAQRMERELEQREERHAEHLMHEMMQHIESLSRQVEELRREVKRLKK